MPAQALPRKVLYAALGADLGIMVLKFAAAALTGSSARGWMPRSVSRYREIGSVRAMTATIAAELGEAAVGSDHYQALFTLGIFLFLVTFLINLTADLVLRGIRKE